MNFQRFLIPVLTAWIVLAIVFPGIAMAEETETIDIDLSACNRGITYAQMMQVCKSPEDYDGKLFRVRGTFNYSQTNELARIIFSDNTGCCEIAFVFQPAAPLVFPDDYPPLWGKIMITARLTVDSSDPDMPCCFTDSVMEWEE